ncbi:MAG: arginyltransferase [Rhizobiales bacterium]|nr:arginyltransferase [Hyphomicrobiales bacterium]
MTEHFGTRFPQFYITTSQACPYLPGRYEKKVFTHLLGDDPVHLNNVLTQAGFRRSQNIAYRPACEACSACVSVRVLVNDFEPSRNFRKIINRNGDLIAKPLPPRATQEQFGLLRSYLDSRHAEGGMADMASLDYATMVEDTTVHTEIIEYRTAIPPEGHEGDSPLIAAALTDVLEDGLSMVYSYYDVEQESRSLGTYMVLNHIERARRMGLPYVYLGYWVADCRKMSYKTRYKPLEALGKSGWARLEGDEPAE